MEDNTEWVILDTETDGFAYPIHAVEIAAQRMRGTERDGEPFRVFLNHQIPIPPLATSIHGYDQGFLEVNGIDPRAAYEQLRSYIGSRPVTSHFLRYDWNAVLLPEWRRLRIPQVGQPGLCSWNLSRRVLQECRSHRLDVLRDTFGLPVVGAHTAIGDIEAVLLLLTGCVFPRLQRIGLNSYNDFFEFSLEKPVFRCHCLIEGKDYAAELARVDSERKQHEEKLRQMEEKRRLLASIFAGESQKRVQFFKTHHLITEDPEIVFEGRTFLFTGKMIWGSRSILAPALERVGAVFSDSKTVRRGLDYLVLGEDPEKGWTRRSGSKLFEALWIRMCFPEDKICFVEESHFIDQMMALTQEQATSADSNVQPVDSSTSISRTTPPSRIRNKPRHKLCWSDLTEATITRRKKTGDTPLHIAAKKGKIKDIPPHLLTTQLFLEGNSQKATPLHLAAMHGYLNRVPAEFLTTETLAAMDSHGRTPHSGNARAKEWAGVDATGVASGLCGGG
jgi:DNA polymerase III epsilon subunit-like protein